jgi:tubulin---tyrosine ligase
MADLVQEQVQDKENLEGKLSDNTEPDRICVVLNGKGKLGTVYSQVARTLSQQGGWKRKRSTAGRFHMVLGEAGGVGIPFKRFSQVFRYDYGIKPLVNYNRNCKTITDKVMLAQVLQRCNNAGTKSKSTSILPETYLFWPGRDEVSQQKQLEEAFANREDNVWIVKPSSNAHGNGIFLSTSFEEIMGHINQQPDGSKPWLVQQYIEKPLLLNGNRKFDIRVWVLLTHDFKVFIHKEGVVRTSSVPFSLADLKNKFIHMTNHSIQEEHSDFGKFEEDNEIFFPQFEEFLRDSTDFSLHGDILPQIKESVKATFTEAKPILESIDEIDDYFSFMFFGFDFAVDTAGKVWLLEVNATPAIAKSLLPKISRDIIRTAIDPMFPRKSEDGKDGDSEFEMIFESEGRCDFVANMPAPDAQENVEIESFGSQNLSSKK